jgi:hypothetical protein
MPGFQPFLVSRERPGPSAQVKYVPGLRAFYAGSGFTSDEKKRKHISGAKEDDEKAEKHIAAAEAALILRRLMPGLKSRPIKTAIFQQPV